MTRLIFPLGLFCTAMIFTAQPIVAAGNEFSPDSIKSLMRKVANYRLKSGIQAVGNGWDGGSYFSGIMGLYRTIKEQKYLDSATAWGNYNNWTPHNGVNTTVGDDQCCEQTYCEVYGLNPTTANAKMISNVKSNLEHEFDVVKNAHTNVWTWCDLCYMSPPAITRYAVICNQPRFLDTMDLCWWGTAKMLYDSTHHFWFRDGSYKNQKTSNGNPVFWSCGEAWVLGGMARILAYMPQTYATRANWEKQFVDVCTATKAQQGSTLYPGLWTTSMLDHQQYPDPETSGSAFFCFAMIWGVNNGILDSTVFLPCIKKAWTDLVANVNAQGMLLRCQTPSAAPASIPVNFSSREGEGAFMLSGEELVKWALGGTSVSFPPSPAVSGRNPAHDLRSTASGISFFLANPRQSALRIYDLKGALVADRSIMVKKLQPGIASLAWESLGISNGDFVVSLFNGAEHVSSRVVMRLHAH
jgi:Predicted unsaturated glucuronyl hydrolase involved in regulation of bacterial surface properties, and related proteins